MFLPKKEELDEQTNSKWIREGAWSDQHWSQKVLNEPKGKQNTIKNECPKKVAKKMRLFMIFGILVDPFWNHFQSKTEEEIGTKIEVSKNIEFGAKGVPKWSQNWCQHSSKFNAKRGIEKDHEIMEIISLWMVKTCKFIVKTMVLQF